MAIASTVKYEAKPLAIKLGPNDSELAAGRTAIIYGNSTGGKTTQLAEAAKYLYGRYKLPVRAILAEDSSKTTFYPLIAGGIVDALFIGKIEDPAGTLRKLSRGEWIRDGEWVRHDRGSVSAYIIEGVSSIAELLQEYNREHKLFLGEQGNQAHTTPEGEVIALPGQFSYNTTQMELFRAFKAFGSIAGVERVLWSAHEGKGTEITNVVKDEKGRDQNVGNNIMGPLVSGKAGTAQVQKYCGLMIHIDMLEDPKTRAVTRRLHMKTHADPKVIGLSSPAKITVPLEAQFEFYARLGTNMKDGFIDSSVDDRGRLVNSLADVLRVEDEVMSELIAKYKGE